VWQGYIESSKETVRVQFPIPRDWLARADNPVLRLVVCSDPPVNEAAHKTWACRRVKAVLFPHPDAQYVAPPRGGHRDYPVIDRTYKLSRYKPGETKQANGDLWLVELSYEEVFEYPPAMIIDPRQRVAFAAELLDQGEKPYDPQAAMQALPIADTMLRLSVSTRSPIVVRTRIS
jgi:hypothetical protein